MGDDLVDADHQGRPGVPDGPAGGKVLGGEALRTADDRPADVLCASPGGTTCLAENGLDRPGKVDSRRPGGDQRLRHFSEFGQEPVGRACLRPLGGKGEAECRSDPDGRGAAHLEVDDRLRHPLPTLAADVPLGLGQGGLVQEHHGAVYVLDRRRVRIRPLPGHLTTLARMA